MNAPLPRFDYDRIAYGIGVPRAEGPEGHLRRRRGRGVPRSAPTGAARSTVEDVDRHDAPHRRRGLPADGHRARSRRTPRRLLRQPLPRHRQRADHGEVCRRSRRLHPPRARGARLRTDRARRLERRRIALALLPGRSRAADAHRDARRRSTGSHHREADPRRRRAAARRARQPRAHLHRVDRSVGDRRERSRPPRSAVEPLLRRQPESPAVHGGVRHALSRRAGRAQSTDHEVGARTAREATPRGPRASRARLRGARNDRRSALARPGARSQRASPRLVLSRRARGRERRADRARSLLHSS